MSQDPDRQLHRYRLKVRPPTITQQQIIRECFRVANPDGITFGHLCSALKSLDYERTFRGAETTIEASVAFHLKNLQDIGQV